jgi:hypothetical protein
LCEAILPHHESRGHDAKSGEKEARQNPRGNTAMGEIHFVEHEYEAEPSEDETTVDQLDFGLRRYRVQAASLGLREEIYSQ